MATTRPAVILAALASLSLLTSSGTHAAPNQGSGPDYEALEALEAQVQSALTAGNNTEALRLGADLLRANTDRSSWNFGNVVYDANQIMGLAALREGHVVAADQYLLAAGNTPGSPQLDSFGPDMKLAQALYAHGERRVIVQFLNEVARFWAVPPPNEPKQFLSLYAMHAATLTRWKTEIAQGKRPSLDRFDFSGGAPAPKTKPLLTIGTPAPDFSVQGRDGTPVRLSDYRGKVVVLDFWATWCGPCQASLPHTEEVAKQFQDQNVVVLAVNVWDTRSAFAAWLPQHTQYDALHFAIDPAPTGQDVATRLYHVSGIPTQYVIGPDGTVLASFVGYGGPSDDLADAIRKAQATTQAAG